MAASSELDADLLGTDSASAHSESTKEVKAELTGDAYIKSLTKNFIKSKRRLNHTISHIKAERKRYQQESITEALNRRKDERTKS